MGPQVGKPHRVFDVDGWNGVAWGTKGFVYPARWRESSDGGRKRKMGRSRTYFGRCYCCSLRKRKKNGSNDLPGVSWPAAGKLVPGGKVCLMSTVTKEQKVVCGWILSCLCCLPTLLWLLFQSLPISLFSISPFPFSSTTSLVRVSTRGCKDLTLILPELETISGQVGVLQISLLRVRKVRLAMYREPDTF